MIKWISIFLLIATPVFAGTIIDYNDVSCMGAWLMEDVGNETDVAKGNTMIETGGTIARSADRKFGDWSRAFVASETEYLTHADNLDTDIFGVDQPITLVAWIKTTNASIVADQDVVGKYRTSNNTRQYRIDIDVSDGERAKFWLSSNGTATTSETGTTDVVDQAWHHLAAVYDDVDMKIYVDGVLEGTPVAYNGGIAEQTEAFNIGVRGGLLQYFDGLIDEVAIFNKALSLAEVNDIMDNGLSPVAAVAAGQVIFIAN